ncbi:hypothetical protein HGP05_03490 [Streptococcus sanguinis]|uniref:Uncharacterized protein n=1 Tax=Streptococcus sanguinis TaxID=1305 RepID=A0A7Y0VC14_STRSA|nr:hypothetical protein [Streptococcus sanguinis]
MEDESSESELETELSEKERKKLEKLQKKAEKEAAKCISRGFIFIERCRFAGQWF